MESSFLIDFLRLHAGKVEVPPIFLMWSGIAGISCALGRKVYVDLGRIVVYPNLYVLLVAGSGIQRKSTAIDMILDLIRHLDPPPNLIAQKLTPQFLVQKIRDGSLVDPHRLLAETCTAFGFPREMSTFLNRSSYEAGLAPILIDFYDCVRDFTYGTIGRGEEKLQNVCFGFISASTVDWIRSSIPEEAIGAGLTSRIIFIHDTTIPDPVPRPTYSEEDRKISEYLIRRLQKIYELSGPALLAPDTIKLYDSIYIKWQKEGGLSFFNDRNLRGYATRRQGHLTKLAIIYAASELSIDKDRLWITPDHIAKAEKTLEMVEVHMQYVMSMITTNVYGNELNLVEDVIRRCKIVSKADLTRTMSHRMVARQLAEIIDTLVEGGRVQVFIEGKAIKYKWTGDRV